MGMLSAITKVIKSLLLQLFGPYIITWSWAHQKKVLKASILIAQMMIKLGVSTTKIKYLTKYIWSIKMFRGDLRVKVGLTQNQNESINNMIWSKCPKRVYVAKADLLFLFVNEMKWGSTWKKVIFGIIKRKMWSKCYCRTLKRKQFTTIKCKVQNNRKIQEMLRQLRKQNKKGNSQVDFHQNFPLCWFYKRGSVSKYKHKMCAKQSLFFSLCIFSHTLIILYYNDGTTPETPLII